MGNNEELGLETNRLEYFRRVLDSTGKGILACTHISFAILQDNFDLSVQPELHTALPILMQ